ncbi:MAG: PAS domain S-box protein, partial [Chloroflexi bacterium]|nr:PAS domain S-box protein [Chloroflexota bacterium]
MDRYARSLKGEKPEGTNPFRLVTKDGLLWVEGQTVFIEWQGKPATLVFLTNLTERKETEEALRQSEEKYRLLADNSLDCIWTLGPDLKLTYASPAVKRIRGVEPEEAMKQTLDDSMTPESKLRFIEELERISPDVEEGKNIVSVLEIEQYHKNGSTVWVEMVLRALYNEAGQFHGFIGASREIGKRKEAQEALRQSEEKYRMLAENTDDVIWTADTDFHFTYMSPSIFKLRGLTAEEAILEELAQSFTPESRQRLSHKIELAAGDFEKGLKTSLTLEAEQYCKDGSTRWTESLIRPLYDNSSKHTGYIGVTRDISERKQAEQRLQASESKFSAAFMATSDPTAITEIESGKIVDINPALELWTGYSYNEVINKSAADLNLWADTKQQAQILEKLFQQEDLIDYETRLRIKDGQVRDVLFSARVIDIGPNKYIFSRVHDVTEIKK